jgi:hypothetical protein
MNPGSARQRLACIFSNSPCFSRCSRLLVGKREGFKALLWAAVVNLILFGAFLTCATPVYETNDDLMMQAIASGFYTGHSDAHLVFTNVLIGWALQFLYGSWAGYNWYFIYLVVVHYAALTAIAFLVVSRRGGWMFTLFYIGFFAVVTMRILLHLQFTTTAFLIGTAGLLLMVDGLRMGNPVNWPKVIAGIFFGTLMCLIREPVALLLAAIACPFLIERLGWAGWRRLLAMFLAFSGIFLMLHGINRWVYQRDPAWAEFSEYNRMRGEIHVTPLARFISKAAPTVGWSENDGWMFSQFYFSDPDVYAGVPRIRLLFDKLRTLEQGEPAASRTYPAGFLFLPNILSGDAKWLMNLAILTAVWCVFAATGFRRRYVVTLLIYYVIFLLLSFYLLTTSRLPERVAYNFPLFIHAICLYWAIDFQNLPTMKATRPGWPNVFSVPLWRAKALRLSAIVLLTIWAFLYLFYLAELAQSLWSANTFNRNLKYISQKICKPLSTLLPAEKRPILVAMPLDSILEQCVFFYPSPDRVPFFLIPYGWITHSPLFSQILERHRLRPYSLSLVDRPEVFYLMKPRWLKPLRMFYREHYGLDIRFDLVLNTDGMPQFEDCEIYLYQAHTVGGKTLMGTIP